MVGFQVDCVYRLGGQMSVLAGSMAMVVLSAALVAGGGSAEARVRPKVRVVIDLSSQRLKVVKAGRVVLRSRVSTGSGKHYCVGGRCGYAVTPVGHFRVRLKIKGWRESRLGLMYKPIYFYRGYALHGSLTVPRRPRSHGCIRVPLKVGEKISSLVHVGDVVIVRR